MCGICGIHNFKSGALVHPEEIEAMKAALVHRGPDGHGSHLDGMVGLGHRRLSVIDLSDAGRQPMSNEDGSVWISCNGEIYNFQELRARLIGDGHVFRSACDAEVVIHLYEEIGTDCLDFLEGMFAIAIWDARRRRLVLARDRIGIKPLYYTIDSDGIAFGSEIKALLARSKGQHQLDGAAAFLYALHMQIPSPRTAFANIKKLPPGWLLIAEKDDYALRQYWKLPEYHQNNSYDNRSEAAVAEQLEDELKRVCRSHLVSDVPIGAFLSGGLDSSAVVALAAQQTNTPLRTFCVSFKEFPNEDESDAAQLVANAYQTIHKAEDMTWDFIGDLSRIVTLCDEPFAISSAFALFGLAGVASQEVKVALSGDGADELFAGYPRHYSAKRSPHGLALGGLLPRLATAASRALTGAGAFGRHINPTTMKLFRRCYVSCLDEDRYYYYRLCMNDLLLARQLFLPDFYRDQIAPHEEELVDGFLTELNSGSNNDTVNRRLRSEIHTTLVDEMLMKVDRMSMGWGLEVRVPFLDHRLVEFAMSIPGRMKHSSGSGKKILKRAIGHHLPATITRREKHGFNVPLAAWFRGRLSGFLDETLSSRKLGESEIFNPKVVREALRLHCDGTHDYSLLLFTVLVWVLWRDQVEATCKGSIVGWHRG
ncbi:MAG: asparagine synthase (glutamine-hydrolyzing) [bacterium]|nr:asparagine synthase (glutamine-hydrolyzing) [bacterium]